MENRHPWMQTLQLQSKSKRSEILNLPHGKERCCKETTTLKLQV